MISKTEFIQRAMALQPPAVKPKKKGWPITFWRTVGGILLCFFTCVWFCLFVMDFSFDSNSEFSVDLGLEDFFSVIFMFTCFWIFYIYEYRLFLHKREIGRNPYRLPWLPWIMDVSIYIGLSALMIAGVWWIVSALNLSFNVWLCIIYLYLGCLYFIFPFRIWNDTLSQKKFRNVPLYRVLNLLGISYCIMPERRGKNFKMQVSNISVLLNVLDDGIILMVSNTRLRQLSAGQKEKILTFFRSSTGQIFADYLFPLKISNRIPEPDNDISRFLRSPLGRALRACVNYFFSPKETKKIVDKGLKCFIYPKENFAISFFRGEYFYPTPEDLPIIYDDVAAFYQTLEEIAHG